MSSRSRSFRPCSDTQRSSSHQRKERSHSGSFETSTKFSDGNSSLPSYAQPTISFTQHATNQSNKILTIKAGVSRLSRPSSVSTIKTSPKPKREPGFLNLFRTQGISKTCEAGLASTSTPKVGTPVKNFDDQPKRSSSGSYRAPALSEDVLKFSETYNSTVTDRSGVCFEGIVKETESLISEIGLYSDDPPIYSLQQLRTVVGDSEYVSKDTWYKFVDYHCLVYQRLQDKVKLDHELIQNVLELNNFISNNLKEQENKLSSANEEIIRLKSQMTPDMIPYSSETPSKISYKSSVDLDIARTQIEKLDIDAPFTFTNEVEVCLSSRNDSSISNVDGMNGNFDYSPDTYKADSSSAYLPLYNFVKNPLTPFVGSSASSNHTKARDVYDNIYQDLSQQE